MTLRKDEKMPITLQLALIGNNRFSFQITRDGKKERCKKHEWFVFTSSVTLNVISLIFWKLHFIVIFSRVFLLAKFNVLKG